MQLAFATGAQANIWIGSDTGSGYDSSSNPVPEGTYDKIYGSKVTEEDGRGREVTGNKLKLDSGHTINDKGGIYGGCFTNEKKSFGAKNIEIAVQVTANSVTIADDTKFDGAVTIYGGYTAIHRAPAVVYATGGNSQATFSFTVASNTVALSNIEGPSSIAVYGGYAANPYGFTDATVRATGDNSQAAYTFTATSNTVTLSSIEGGGSVVVYGGYAANRGYVYAQASGSNSQATHGFTASSNTVTLSDIKGASSVEVYGGYVANALVIADARASGDNSQATHSFTASGNTVTVSSIERADSMAVYGGYAANVASADVTASSINSQATHGFTASGNTVTLSNIEKVDRIAVYGGYAGNVVYGDDYEGYNASADVSASGDHSQVTHSFTASGNTVTLSDIKGASSVEVYGGYAANAVEYAEFSWMSCSASASATGDNSQATHSFTASGNTVTLSNIESVDSIAVYGGYVVNAAVVNADAYMEYVNVDASIEVAASGDHSQATHSFTASGNTVALSDIEGASRVEVYGGYVADVVEVSTETNAEETYADVNAGVSIAATGDDSQATHSFTASGNTVVLSDIKGASSVEVYGGYAENNAELSDCKLKTEGSTVKVTESVAASGNTVKLTNVDASEVYGGNSSLKFDKDTSLDLSTIAIEGVTVTGKAEASGNTVEFYGGSYTGDNLYAGWSSADILSDATVSEYVDVQRSAEAINNTVALYAYEGASPRLNGVVLWGGYAKVNGVEVTGGEVKENNKLEFHEVKGMTAKNIKNFDTLTFTLPVMAASEAVLTLTDEKGTDISDATVTVTNEIIDVKGSDGGEFKADDEVVLLKNVNGLTKERVGYNSREFNGQPDAATRTILGQTGISLQYQLELQETETSIVLKCTDKKKTVQEKDTTVLPGTKAIAEGAAAGLVLVNEAANAGMAFARDFSPEEGVAAPFVYVHGSSVTHETGSSVHLNAVSLMAGIGAGLDTGFGKLSAGAFFEYGKGSYTTSNSFDNAPDVNGDGNAWYMGGGVIAKMEFLETGSGHFYVEGSAHMGQLHNEYDSKDLHDVGGRIAKFDLDSPYYSLHGGLGYVWNITEDHDLDVYGNYIWTRVQGTDETLTTGDKFEFDDMDSSRVRFGARYTYKGSERFRPYIGAAYEHEFAGSCESTTFGHSVAAPSFEGDTGMGELGITMMPSKDLPLSVNLGVQGYVGQKQGISGNCLIKYEF